MLYNGQFFMDLVESRSNSQRKTPMAFFWHCMKSLKQIYLCIVDTHLIIIRQRPKTPPPPPPPPPVLRNLSNFPPGAFYLTFYSFLRL